MGAYKQLNAQDLIISPFEVNKGFHFIGSDALTGSNVGVGMYVGRSGNYLISSSFSTTGRLQNIGGPAIPIVLLYDSIKQLYYTNYLSGSAGFTQDAITSSVLLGANETGNTMVGGIQQSNFYNYEQTTLWPNKDFPTASVATSSVPVGIISIPSKLFGDYIQPESFLFEGPSGSIKDDGEGRLLWKHPNRPATGYEYMMGNIIYQHGIVTLFDSETVGNEVSATYGTAVYGTDIYGGNRVEREAFINAWFDSRNVTMSFSSSYKLFETQYQCTINENEFNYSLNPSIITGSEIPTRFSGSDIEWENTASIGTPLGFSTSSYFEPYITTVGLYDEDYQLLAVGKLAKPLQSSPTTDTTILVNIDR
tara:strand:- start:490 stop:1584 length:1095 start_codon:yes stop_codon:yes gene_type:complete